MKKFLQRHADDILGVLSGFDRIRLRGSLRLLQTEGGVASWLSQIGVALKDFNGYVQKLTSRLCRRMDDLAGQSSRKTHYFPGVVDKEDVVQEILAKEGPAENGLIAVLSAVEPVMSYVAYRRDAGLAPFIRRMPRKCKHYYVYWMDARFGVTQVRLSSWFPFDCHVMLNGREWLARQLDAKKIGYLRQDNCLVSISDFAKAQRLANEQPHIDWIGNLDRILRRAHPLHADFFSGDGAIDYYWTAEQTEWATDIAFHDPKVLQRLYPQLLQQGIQTFQSPDVLRFLGHKTPAHGGVNGHYQGRVTSDLKRREEGIRLKHRAGKNSVKMYNKQPTILRVETTLNDTRGLKVYRSKQDDPDGKPDWRNLRKSVMDLPRRCQLSQASNDRYLESLSTVANDTPLSEVTDKLCRPVTIGKRRHRGLRPFDPEDVQLLKAITQGEFLISGFRNKDIRAALYSDEEDQEKRRRQAGRVSRKFALLRAHGLIKKVPRTQRYLLTDSAIQIISALLGARRTSLAKLSAA